MSSQANRKHYSARVATELALAAQSADATARISHNKLAACYAALLADLDDEVTESA